MGGTYYLQLHGREDAGADVPFSLTADAAGFEITKVSPLRGSNLVEPAIIELNGSQFTPQTLVHLLMPGGQSRFGESVHFVNANRIVATVDLTGLPTGNYQVVAEDAGKAAIAFDTFTVTANPPGETGAFIWLKNLASVRLATTGSIRQFVQQRIAFGEFNTSDSPLPASLYVIEATNVKPSQEKVATIGSDTVPPRMLPGDYRNDDVRIVSYQPATSGNGVKSTYSLFAIEPTQTSMNWNAQKANLRPDTVSLDAWDAIWENLRPRLGETVADFWALLTNDSEKLAVVGDSVVDIHRLFSLELQMANNMPAVPVPASAVDVAFPEPGLPLVFGRGLGETLTGRYRQGRLGRGWTDNFDISILADATTGTATLKQGGIVRYFGRLADGSYESLPGDSGVLSKVSGAFQLRESSGDVTKFRPDGLLDSLEDANGNRITAGYVANQLTSLTHSNGAALTLVYNAQGRIRQVTDPAGGVATYEYDASGEHLIRVITTAGTTEYAYSSDVAGPRKHALTTITFLDGTHLFFDYDSNGRLARQQGDGGAQTQRFAYDTASFSVTDARDQVTTFLHDDSFRIRQVRDPLGRLSYIEYDAANNPVIVGSPEAASPASTTMVRGTPRSCKIQSAKPRDSPLSPLTTAWSSGRMRLDTIRNTSMISTGTCRQRPMLDGSTEQYSYDAQGNLVGTVNRLGQIIQFTYNSRGQVKRKDLPGGAHVDYTYNDRDNLETVIDATGTTTLEYLDAQNPDLLTKIMYANGRFLEYTYQNGRRTRMADQAGFATTYSYDSAGRLDVLRDGNSVLIVDYDYDLSGQLARETRGNGTVTELRL